ncbi:MAG: hypothetical protein ABR598_04950 [Candidatus Dormibacteria bacterium]
MSEESLDPEPRQPPVIYSPPPGVVPGGALPEPPPAPPAPPTSYEPGPAMAYAPPPPPIPAPVQAPAYEPAYEPGGPPAYTAPPAAAVAAAPAPAIEPVSSPAAGARGVVLPGIGAVSNQNVIYAGLAAVGVVALVIGGLVYQSAAKTDTAKRLAAADRAIAKVMKDESSIGVGDKLKAAFEPIKGPESPPKNYNGDSVRMAIAGVQPGVDSAAKTVDKDQGIIRTALTSINDRGPLSLTSGGELDPRAARLEAVGHALDVRTEEIATTRSQLTLLGEYTSAEENFGALGAALDSGDLVSATAKYTTANNAIQKAAVEAQQPSTPDAVRNLVTQMSQFMDATQSVINSLNARNRGQYQESLRGFSIKLSNLLTYDPKTMRKQYDDLVKSYDDRYNSYIHDAGLSTGGKAL